MKKHRLNDVFYNWVTGYGIFFYLSTYEVPWADLGITATLDLEYHGNISGDKWCSPLIEKTIVDDELPVERIDQIANILYQMNIVNWQKQYATLSEEYNPIENYSMTEQMTNDIETTAYGRTDTRTDNLNHAKTGTETQTPNLTNLTNNDMFGYNSNIEVPSAKQTVNTTGTNTMQYNTSDTDTGTQGNVSGGQDTKTRNYVLTRSGNIGVTTSQQMLQSERDLWIWNFFYNVVFPDIDRVLTLKIY